MKTTFVVLIVISFLTTSCYNKEYNIVDYGAIGDGVVVNTQFIQEAIDDCNKNGGGTVLVPSGKFVTGTILLKDNVNFHLAGESELIGSENPNDYINIDPFVDGVNQQRGKCLIGIHKVSNVSITGDGIVNGRGYFFKRDSLMKRIGRYDLDKKLLGKYVSERPFLFRLVSAKNVRIEGIKMKNSAAWTCHLSKCDSIFIKEVSINSHVNSNNDGIDIDSSADVFISQCNIDTGDDAICFKTTTNNPCKRIYVDSCVLKSNWGAIKFGTESVGDMCDINIKDCHIYNTRGGGIKILSADGANIRDINISNITMDSVDMPVFIRLCKRLRSYRGVSANRVGSIRDINISNITAKTYPCDMSRVNPPSGILLLGLQEKKIENITLRNIHITLPGGGTKENRDVVIPMDETRYPEYRLFGVMPAYGMTARFVKDIVEENVNFALTGKDERNARVFIDIN